MNNNSFRLKLIGLPRIYKKFIFFLTDTLLILFATWISFCVRYEAFLWLDEPMWHAASVSLIIAWPIFIITGFYRKIFRHEGLFGSVAFIKPYLLYFFIFSFIVVALKLQGVPRSVGFIQPMILFTFLCAARYFANRLLKQKFLKNEALIYGSGAAGRQLAAGLRQSGQLVPIGYIDDDPRYWNNKINGLIVYPPSQLPLLISSNKRITDILLAIPSASRLRQREILDHISTLPIHVRILPCITQLAKGLVKIEDVREVEVDDVLGRAPIEPNVELLHQNIYGKAVMVTGAGGSIGSELCRQIIAQRPAVLVLYELSEFALYSIERQLTQIETPIQIIPILGSVIDGNKLYRVIRRFGIETIYHAAAYKHVPMIEMNPAAGVWNNVFGTLRTVDAACRAGVKTFVLVSTDKAVRPTNVMGCTKRFAELVLQAKSSQKSPLDVRTTKLTMVRFGNVLGSSGSVVPVFREQIKKGGPVTVTHPEIIRYFMTIPEAAQLVIQAGAMGEGGDVMVLDMGQPVKIVDLAKRMIHLSGFSHKDEENLDGDIEIEFTGLRPGEKLYEELLIGDDTLPTSHSRIMRAVEQALPWDELEPLLIELEAEIKADNSDAIRSLLKKAVPEFNPQSENGDVLKE